jgi:hypothetical protein
MNENELYRRIMQGVDVEAAAASFWASHPPSTIRQSVSLSLQASRSRTPRPPRPSSSITPSQHRPHVLASDRLLLWSTPSGMDWQASLEQKYPNSSLFRLFQVRLCVFSLTILLISLSQVMIRSLDTDTRSNYGTGLLRFTQFCDSINIPEAERMPASEALISQFAAAFAGSSSEKTLNNWLAGLHFWHVVNGAPWLASHLLHHTR